MLRNKEIRRFAGCFLGIAAVTGILGFWTGWKAGILSVVASAAFGILFTVFTCARYHRLAHMAEQIDLVLHNAEPLYMDEAEEGELSILQSEITKMTMRIYEQNAALKREKKHLADSLADIAHQLRTPLTSANLILSLLQKNPDQHERVRLLHETAELFAQMEWLINSLLKLSRLDAGIVEFQNKIIDVGELIRAAAQPLLISMELHQIHLHVEGADEMVIQGDFSWLSEALRNILKNCMQSVGDDGSIDIVCSRTVLYDEIQIHDSGPGFTNEDLAQLFERFYRGKGNAASGYGIGMAICRTILVRHGGIVSAENHPHGGAVFYVRFFKDDHCYG